MSSIHTGSQRNKQLAKGANRKFDEYFITHFNSFIP